MATGTKKTDPKKKTLKTSTQEKSAPLDAASSGEFDKIAEQALKDKSQNSEAPMMNPANMPLDDRGAYQLGEDLDAARIARLSEAVGPEEPPQSFGGQILGVLSGLDPNAQIGQGEVIKQQQAAAFELSKLLDQQKATRAKATRLDPIDTKNWKELNEKKMIIRKAESDRKKIYDWLSSRSPEPGKRKNRSNAQAFIDFAKGIGKKIEEWARNKTGTQTEKQAIGQQVYWRMINKHLKQMSGATITDAEAERLFKGLPDADSINVGTFMKQYDNMINQIKFEFDSLYEDSIKTYRNVDAFTDFYKNYRDWKLGQRDYETKPITVEEDPAPSPRRRPRVKKAKRPSPYADKGRFQSLYFKKKSGKVLTPSEQSFYNSYKKEILGGN